MEIKIVRHSTQPRDSVGITELDADSMVWRRRQIRRTGSQWPGPGAAAGMGGARDPAWILSHGVTHTTRVVSLKKKKGVFW